MLIRNFQDSDIKEASNLSQLTWGDFYTNQSVELQTLIYSFMVEYYDLNRKYSFSIVDENNLKAYLLAFTKTDNSKKLVEYKNKVQLLESKQEQQIVLELFDYLEACGKSLKEIIDENYVILGLFVSTQKGCGRMLLTELVKACIENGISKICLWTDTTCNYDYYKKNNFILKKEVETFINGKTIKTLIYEKQIAITD